MRFHMKFTRRRGAGAGVVLGSDSAPSGPPKVNADNVLSAHIKASWGSPVKRIAVIYVPPSGAQALDGEMYVWDGLTESWHKLPGGGSGAIKPGEVVFFDFPAVSDRNLQPGGENTNHASGFTVALVAADHASAQDGVHTFGMAAVVTGRD